MTKLSTDDQKYPEMIAAVDLGSNSFHLIVARVDEHGNFSMVDQMKEMVRLRGGLDKHNNMDETVAHNALECLQRFGDRIRHLKPEEVRAAGTNTLRTMKKSSEFLRKANKALGHHIDIIPGREEARLVYLGVSHTLSDDEGKQLVVDIGGGSTEFIIGKKFEPKHLESLNFGSVSVTKRFFSNGDLSLNNWQTANTALRLEIMPIQREYSQKNWKRAIGSSGTIKATLSIIQELALGRFAITLNALYEIRDKLIAIGRVDNINLPGLNQNRAPVYAGGLAIIIAVFEALNIEIMSVSEGALREGLLYDMLGRINHEDVRERSVKDLMSRFNIDVEHASRVKKTALHCFSQVHKDWGLSKKRSNTLAWAADLHELGMSITHDKHQFQGAHILDHADIPGFNQRRQHWLAVLVQTHRKKIESEIFDTLLDGDRQTILYLCILLRIAVLLHRSRQDRDILPNVSAEKNSMHISFVDSLKDQALLEADLMQEKVWLGKMGFDLTFY